MRNLVFSALAIAGLTQASGCIIGGGSDDGTFSLTWTLEDPAGNLLTCSEAGADQVELLVTLQGTTQGTADRWDCNDAGGQTFALTPGFYDFEVNALQGTGDAATAIGFGGSGLGEIVADADTDLGHFDIVIDGGSNLVNFDITVDYGTAGGDNCTETAAGGSGVIQQIINIYDAGGATCLDYAILTAQDTLGTCVAEICQENTVVQTLQLDPGVYDIEIWGLKGGVDDTPAICYSITRELIVQSDDSFDFVVPFEPINDPDDECNATKPDRSGR